MFSGNCSLSLDGRDSADGDELLATGSGFNDFGGPGASWARIGNENDSTVAHTMTAQPARDTRGLTPFWDTRMILCLSDRGSPKPTANADRSGVPSVTKSTIASRLRA